MTARWTLWRDYWRMIRCGMRGHLWELQLEPHRIALKCIDCETETEGWNW